MLTLNNMLNNQDTFGQIESNGTGEAVYSNGQMMRIQNQIETLQFQILCRRYWQKMTS